MIQNFERLNTIVILDNKKIVGYLSYVIKKRHTGKLDVDQLVILEEYRGKGLGKKLMEEAKQIAKENECDRIELNCWLFNENALNMYEHIGYNRQRIIYEMKCPLREAAVLRHHPMGITQRIHYFPTQR